MKRKLKRILRIGFLCCVSIFVVWRLTLAYLVHHRLAKIRSAGLPTNGEELGRWLAKVPDAENAALVMEEAFEMKHEFSQERAREWSGFRVPARGQPLPEDRKQFLADYVATNTDALAKASEATRLPKSRYPVVYSAYVDSSWHLTQLRRLAEISQYEGLLAIGSNQPVVAANSIARILGMARTLDDEPTMLTLSVRKSMIITAVDLLQYALNHLDAPELSGLSEAFGAADKTGLCQRALIGERAMLIPTFGRRNPRDNDSSESGADPTDDLPIGPPVPGGARWFIGALGIYARDLNFYLKTMESDIALTGLGPPRSLATEAFMEKAGQQARRRLCLVSALTLLTMTRQAEREADVLARARLAKVALALEDFRRANGKLPGT